MKAKNPIFLEAVQYDEEKGVNIQELQNVVEDYSRFVNEHTFAGQEAIFGKNNDMKSLKDGFEAIQSWVTKYYND